MGESLHDRLIGEVAHSLTRGEPRADLRARVLARVDAAKRTPRSWGHGWLMVPAAVSAMMVAAVLIRDPNPARLDSRPIAMPTAALVEGRAPSEVERPAA